MPKSNFSDLMSAIRLLCVIDAIPKDRNGWLLGYCPVHDAHAANQPAPLRYSAGELGSAEFNTDKGVWRCLDDEKHCHDRRELPEGVRRKRAQSLANLFQALDDERPGWADA